MRVMEIRPVEADVEEEEHGGVVEMDVGVEIRTADTGIKIGVDLVHLEDADGYLVVEQVVLEAVVANVSFVVRPHIGQMHAQTDSPLGVEDHVEDEVEAGECPVGPL